MNFTWLEPRGIVTVPSWTKQCRIQLASSLLQVSPQRILPSRHFDAIPVQACCRKHRIRWTWRGSRHLLTANGPDSGRQVRRSNDLLRKFEPGAIACICHVHDPASTLLAKLNDGPREV